MVLVNKFTLLEVKGVDGVDGAVGVKDEDVERGTKEVFCVVTGVGGNDGSGS